MGDWTPVNDSVALIRYIQKEINRQDLDIHSFAGIVNTIKEFLAASREYHNLHQVIQKDFVFASWDYENNVPIGQLTAGNFRTALCRVISRLQPEEKGIALQVARDTIPVQTIGAKDDPDSKSDRMTQNISSTHFFNKGNVSFFFIPR